VESFAHRPAKNAARSVAAAWLGVDRSKRSASQTVIPEEIDADQKRSDHTHSRRSRITRATTFRRSCSADRQRALDDVALGNFFRIIVLTLSDFLLLSVAPHAFSNRADKFFEIVRQNSRVRTFIDRTTFWELQEW
jgi:hypothetical protein